MEDLLDDFVALHIMPRPQSSIRRPSLGIATTTSVNEWHPVRLQTLTYKAVFEGSFLALLLRLQEEL
jgi:hypothetical protein